MSDGCGTYAHWTLHVWVPNDELKRAVNDLRDVEASVVAPSGDLPDDAGQVEVVVPGWPIGRDRFAEIVAVSPKLRLVQTTSAGIDHIVDLVPPTARLCDARGVYDVPMAEWVLAGILAAIRNVPRYAVQQRDRTWAPGKPAETAELGGSRVLIVGYGAIGAAVEKRLAPFGVTVDRVARTARDGVHGIDALPELLPTADIVVLLVPLTDETRGLLDKRTLGALRDGALLVNAARGAVVDTDALLFELESGRLRAVLDVTDPEPLPADHPLWTAPNVLITPHIGGPTTQLSSRVTSLVCEQVERYRDGNELRNIVSDGY
jgi:phosphoglycerate dehydrogenase-like enzyme